MNGFSLFFSHLSEKRYSFLYVSLLGLFKNDLKHTEGVLSMARSQSKNSGGSQFFIMTKDSPHLDGSYASFGKVIKGMDIVHNIENTETLPGDRPSEDVIIESIKVDTKGENYPKPNKL